MREAGLIMNCMKQWHRLFWKKKNVTKLLRLITERVFIGLLVYSVVTFFCSEIPFSFQESDLLLWVGLLPAYLTKPVYPAQISSLGIRFLKVL